MILECLEVGPLMVNCYIIGCEETKIGAVVDPGDETERILETAKSYGLKIEQIINTHGHADHIAANREVKNATGADIYIHQGDSDKLLIPNKNLSIYFGDAIDSPPAVGFLEEGKTHKVGNLEFKILHVPGHSKGSACLLRDDVCIVGDTVFNGSIGRTDFPDGNYEQLIDGIKSKLLSLPDDTALLPGHGPATNVAYEKKFNPFLKNG